MFQNKRTQVLLFSALGVAIISAGVLIYGVTSGKINTHADTVATQTTVTGLVKDDAGEPVQGTRVNVFIKSKQNSTATWANTNIGSSTDANGRYTIKNFPGGNIYYTAVSAGDSDKFANHCLNPSEYVPFTLTDKTATADLNMTYSKPYIKGQLTMAPNLKTIPAPLGIPVVPLTPPVSPATVQAIIQELSPSPFGTKSSGYIKPDAADGKYVIYCLNVGGYYQMHGSTNAMSSLASSGSGSYGGPEEGPKINNLQLPGISNANIPMY